MASGPSKTMRKRMLIAVSFITLICFSVVSVRLFFHQVIDYEFYSEKASAQQMRDMTVSANRGTIYDSNMKVLAQSAPVYTVVVSPVDTEEEDKIKIAEGLSSILGADKDTILSKLAKKNSYYEIIKKKVDKTVADEVRKFMVENKLYSIYLNEDTKRYYTYGNFAANILGFVGDDNQGLNGVEAYYNKYLTGTPGRVVSAKNAWGNDMPYEFERLYEPKDGYSLVLTVDEVIQHYLEKHLEVTVAEHNVKNRVAGIVMNVNTGEILAMATKQDYDPNNPFSISDPNDAAKIALLSGDERNAAVLEAQQAQWRNKAVSDLYEPGSVFKVVTAAAAIDEQLVSMGDMFNCTGSVKVADHTMRCHDHSGHGRQTFLEAIKSSCNPVFIEIGARLGADKFYKYFNAFGLTRKTGIDLPGEAASIYYRENQLNPVELASVSFGQSNKITPIQMITAISAAVNGGSLVQPHVVKQILDNEGNVYKTMGTNVIRQAISKETSELISYALEETVVSGGGVNAYIKGYRIGGKSGTAEKLDGDENDRIASFVAIAPADDPQIAVLVMIDCPNSFSSYGGTIAAPVAGGIMADVLPYVGVEKKFTQEELQNLEVSVINVIGKTPHAAQAKLNQIGLNSRIIGDGEQVIKQVPASGESVPKNSTVLLYTTEDTASSMVTVPNVLGLSVAQANQKLINAGLNIKINGPANTSNVISTRQSIEAGTQVMRGTVVTVDFINVSSSD